MPSAHGSAKQLICITGAPRSGTHLLNALLCQSPAVHALLTECAPLITILRGYVTDVSHFRAYPDMYFSSLQEVQLVAAGHVRELADRIAARYGAPVVVFRSPLLATFATQLLTVLSGQPLPYRILCMVRDPRDIVASIMRWSDKRIAGGKEPLYDPHADAVKECAGYLDPYYRKTIRLKDSSVRFIRYEDLVADPRAAMKEIYETCSLDFSEFDPGREWNRVKANLQPDDPLLGDCITDLYRHPATDSSVGSYRDVLSPEQQRVVCMKFNYLSERFYPELVIPAG